jgi:hypothetical protein
VASEATKRVLKNSVVDCAGHFFKMLDPGILPKRFYWWRNIVLEKLMCFAGEK